MGAPLVILFRLSVTIAHVTVIISLLPRKEMHFNPTYTMSLQPVSM